MRVGRTPLISRVRYSLELVGDDVWPKVRGFSHYMLQFVRLEVGSKVIASFSRLNRSSRPTAFPPFVRTVSWIDRVLSRWEFMYFCCVLIREGKGRKVCMRLREESQDPPGDESP